MKRAALVVYLDSYLNVADIKDYGPQGLQVEAEKEEITRLALAVDAAPAVIEAAAAWGADMLLVHHGVLWRSVEPIAGPLGRRVRLLLGHGIHLYAAHLPLDAHPEVGNNAVLARLLDVSVAGWWCAPTGTPLGVYGQAQAGTTLAALAGQVEERLQTTVRVLAYGPAEVQSVAILSGFGADEVAGAKAVGADTFLTGETSHAHYWAAADHGLNVIYAGHYATETVGVQALGQHLAAKYGLEVRFFDFPSGM
ncbi:MAG: Nif3-like dinuclear metal center hexameric protein [Chloroflexi bacterium]|nr:Nif3-like dinuclear metal center hexameric protein [Chloroflexota bacterium]MCI0578896.1 Nif3-like dinuclear metal center hexameric protein [Chloroflexota bacterium]MCI0649137.1 Nif3-like dinuclear metal center hexameric protein [Chloroflexota bacterium]MCI0727052.1 Nif3-like dinuclear metal center hexameric protein [Chloroflexota bacterium]